MELRALVAEDDASIRNMLQFSLALEGIETLSVDNGGDVLGLLASDPVDIVILDIMMPVLNGYQVLERLRESDSAFASVPVIMATAKAGDQDIWKGWAKGVDSYISKPIDMDLLVSEIMRLTARVEVAA